MFSIESSALNQKENELWLLSQRRDCIQLEIAGAARALFDQPLTFSTDVFPMFQRARLEQSCLEQRIVCCNQLREPALSCNGAPHPGAAFAGDFHRPAFNMHLRRRSDDAAKTLDEMIGEGRHVTSLGPGTTDVRKIRCLDRQSHREQQLFHEAAGPVEDPRLKEPESERCLSSA